MKITRRQLRSLILNEVQLLVEEQGDFDSPGLSGPDSRALKALWNTMDKHSKNRVDIPPEVAEEILDGPFKQIVDIISKPNYNGDLLDEEVFGYLHNTGVELARDVGDDPRNFKPFQKLLDAQRNFKRKSKSSSAARKTKKGKGILDKLFGR